MTEDIPNDQASAAWTPVAAPAGDLPAALSGDDRPEHVSQQVQELEALLSELGCWLRDVNVDLLQRVQGQGSGRPLVPATGLPHARGGGPAPAIEAGLTRLATRYRQLVATIERTGTLPAERHLAFLEDARATEALIRQAQADTWNRLANIDWLTGLGNRAAMLRKLAIECGRHARLRQPCCVAVLDLDNFKQINDTYGHPAGDAVLRSVASLLAASVRPYDEVFRFGGDEFVLCLPNADPRTAWAIVERLRLRVADWPIPARAGEPLQTTLSIGVAPLLASLGVDGSLERADAALYAAKRNGRNTVVIAGVDP